MPFVGWRPPEVSSGSTARGEILIPPQQPLREQSPVSFYAWNVLSGKVVACRYVILACERHFYDLASGRERGLTFSHPHAAFALRFFAAFLRHSKGEWAGRPLALEPWQEFAIGSVYGWFRADKIRRFRTAYEEVARKNGKALRHDTPVPTPQGWCRHGDLKPGDLVFDPYGKPVRILATSESYAGPYRRMVFSDGTEIIAHDRHEWWTVRTAHTGRPRGSRRPLPEVETRQIAATLRHSSRGDFTHGIPTALALDTGPDVSLPLPPYTFGVWLGDGTSLSADIASADAEVISAIREEGVPIEAMKAQSEGNKAKRYSLADKVNLGLFADGRPTMRIGFRNCLRKLGVLGDKHVPPIYLRASIRQRRELLAGLVDSDGHVTPRGQCEVVLTNRKLFDGVVELARTLGFKPTVVEDRAKISGVDKGPRYRMQFWPMLSELPLRVPRKRDRLKMTMPRRSRTRMIISCEPVEEVVGKCISVEGGMYLAGEGMVPTHNSTMAAGAGLFGLIADGEPGAEIYAAATRRDQARIIFSEAQQMVRRSPALSGELTVFKLNISMDSTMSKFEPLSADDRTLDGLNPHLVLVDELHKHRNRAVLDVLDTAVGARRNPLLWLITTAGDDDPETVYAAENSYAAQVLEGTVTDDRYFATIYTLDKDDRWDDPACWIKANPNLGVSIKIDDIERQAQRALHSPSNLAAFKRMRLNVRTGDVNRAIDMQVWGRNDLGSFDPAEMAGRRFYAGLDVSSKIDLTAWVKLYPPAEERQRWRIVPRFWMPSDTVQEKSDRDRVQYRRWIDAGLIEITEGNVVDQNEIEAAILEDCRQAECISCGYDPWNATALAVRLAGQGVPMVEFIQGMRSYTAPTKELEVMLLSQRLDHGGNQVLAWMAASMMVLTDRNENRMPSKKHSVGRIDGMSALIMAIGRSLVTDPNAGLDGFLNDPVAL
jgi:phage terminase large subunit-like protein